MVGIGLKISSLCALLTLALAGAALAHVEVEPSEVPAGSPEKLTVSALGEKEISVVEVRMEIPDGFRVTGVPPVDGWESSQRKGSSGATSAIVWSGGEIQEGRVAEFPVEVLTPVEGGEYTWNGFDEYSDGSVTEWTGPPDSETPATLMLVASEGAVGDEPAKADHHEEEAGDHDERGAHPEETGEGPGRGEEVPDTGGPNPLVVLGAGAAVFVASLMLLYGTTRARR